MADNDATDDGIELNELTRRRVLYGGSAAGIAAMAGCLGGDGGQSDGETTDSGDDAIARSHTTDSGDGTTTRSAGPREQRLFREAIRASGHSVYFTDRDGTIFYVNPAFEETTEYTPEEALGQTPAILKSGVHDREFYEELWDTILSNEVWRSRIVNRRKSGERYVVDQTIAPVENDDGDVEWFVAVNADITELERRERELERSRERLHALFEHSPDAIVVHDAEGNVRRVNRQHVENLGYSREELLEITADYYDALAEDDGSLAAFAPNCVRIENGFQTTCKTPPPEPDAAELLRTLDAGEQLDAGAFSNITRVESRRFDVADVETGLVCGLSQLRHPMEETTLDIEGVPGVETVERDFDPFDTVAMHVFKISGGKIRAIEAVGIRAPYESSTGWE